MQSRFISKDEFYFNQSASGGSLPGTFTNDDLVDGILTIEHNLNTESIIPSFSNPAGYSQALQWQKDPSDTKNKILVDFTGDIDGGDWKYIIAYWNAFPSGEVIPPTASLDKVKNYLKIDLNETLENDLILSLVKSAVEKIESYCNILLRNCTVSRNRYG